MVIQPSSLGARVRFLREGARLSQPVFARLMGLSVSYVSLLESGRRENPTLSVIRKICGFFACSREWLIDGIGMQFSSEPEAARALYFDERVTSATGEERFLFREQQMIAEIVLRVAQSKGSTEADWYLHRRVIVGILDTYVREIRNAQHSSS